MAEPSKSAHVTEEVKAHSFTPPHPRTDKYGKGGKGHEAMVVDKDMDTM